MKKTTVLIYSIFAGIIYLFAILFLGINVYNEYSHGSVRIERRFTQVANTIQQTSLKMDVESPGFKTEIDNIIGNFNDFESFQVSVGNKQIYSYSITDTEVSEESNFTEKKSKAYTVNGHDIYITATLYKLRPASIFANTKIAFLIVLIITLLTIILIILVKVKEQKTQSTAEYDEADFDNEANIVNDEDPIEIDYESTVSFDEPAPAGEEPSVEETEEEPVVVDTEVVVESEEEPVIDDDIATETESEPVETEAKEPVALPVDDIKPMEVELSEDEENPKGLFNEVTGLGWESYLMPRLENEVNRATASEIDLGLFIISLPEMDRTSELFKEICEYLEVQFQFKDLLFEYKEDCIAAMKINMNIDEALTFADKLCEEITEIIGTNLYRCFIGLSTRTIRMITAERLLKEADEALVHAYEDPESRVIAFRADAAKYRKFIENQ